MTDKKKPSGPTLAELREHSNHVANVLVNNARTDSVVYGLILSLQDEHDRGVTRRKLKKELQDAILLAQEQYTQLFFGEPLPFDEKAKTGGE